MPRSKKTGRPSGSRQDSGLAQAIAAAGSVTELAAALGLTVQAVSQWKRVPAERCAVVEEVTGIERQDLRPDIYKQTQTRVAA